MIHEPSDTTSKATSVPLLSATSRDNRWLIAVAVIAALSHGLFYFFRPAIQPSPDEREYISLAINLATQGHLVLPDELVAKRMPVYPFLLSYVYRWQGPELWMNGALLLQSVISWCSVVFIALIARHLCDPMAGLIAGITVALYSPFLYLQMSFLTEGISIFLLCAALLIYLRWGLSAQGGKAIAALLGVSVLLGISSLTRANAILFMVPFVIDAAFRRAPALYRFMRVAALVLPAGPCILGWTTRNQRELGAAVLSTSGGLNFYLGHNANYGRNPTVDAADYGIFDRLHGEQGLSELEADQRLYALGRQFIRENPSETVINVFRKTAVWFTSNVPSHGPTLPILALSLMAPTAWRALKRPQIQRVRRTIAVMILVLLPLMIMSWLYGLPDALIPFTTPLYVVSLGVPALMLLRTDQRIEWLLWGLVLSQLLTAVIFIPLTRIRWTIDFVFIIAIAVGVSRLRYWIAGDPSQSHGNPDLS